MAWGRCILGRLLSMWPGLPLSVRESNRVPFSESGCISPLSLWDPDPASEFRASRFWSRKQGPIYGHEPPSHGHLGLGSESRASGPYMGKSNESRGAGNRAQVGGLGPWASGALGPSAWAASSWLGRLVTAPSERVSGLWARATRQVTLYGPQRVSESLLTLASPRGLGDRICASVSL